MTDTTVSARVDPIVSERITRLAAEHDLSRSEVIRRLLDNGLRARKYHDGFEISP